MTVPLQDPKREYRELAEEIDRAVSDLAASGRYVLGPEVEALEEAVAAYVGTEHAVGVASGTDALWLTLRALGVGPGDEVITSPFTFFATVEAILHAGAAPVFADIDPATFNLDPEAAAAAVTERTAALLPVHLFGQMAEMEPLLALAEREGLAVVEDAAQALGARQQQLAPAGGLEGGAGAATEGDGATGRGKVDTDRVLRSGAAGDAGCFSFYPTKNLGGWGEGGMVTTDDAALAERLRRLRDHGQGEESYVHHEVGHNSRLDSVQAAVLRVKLGSLDAWNARRREHAAAYDRALAGVEGVEAPREADGNHHVYHQYTVRCRERDAVREELADRGIGHGVYYPRPLHLQEPLSALGYVKGAFPEAERAAGEVLSLPVFPTLRPEERARVVKALEGLGAAG